MRSENIMSIEFRDLKRQYNAIKHEVDSRISSIINSTRFISGSEVKELEKILASYTDRKHCISCANGTDAISIALIAAGIGAGDAVFVPDFTFFSSGECPATAGAVPVFVDVRRDTYNIDAAALEANIRAVMDEGQLKPCAVVAVDLSGSRLIMMRYAVCVKSMICFCWKTQHRDWAECIVRQMEIK